MTATNVGFIGLGNIGKPIAQNLVTKGPDKGMAVWVYDVVPEPVQEMVALGATGAQTPTAMMDIDRSSCRRACRMRISSARRAAGVRPGMPFSACQGGEHCLGRPHQLDCRAFGLIEVAPGGQAGP